MPKGRRSPSPVRAYGARKHENGVRKREEGFLYPNGFIARCLRFACLLVSTRDKDPKRSAFVFPGPAPSSLEINSFFSVKTSQRLISMQRNPLFFLFLCVSFILRTSLSGTLETARIGYATEGALFISMQLSTDADSALRKVWVLIRPEILQCL